MTRWLVVSAIYGALFLISSKFEVGQAIVGGLICGGVSIIALKIFGIDKKE